jgi:hypothetical protein
MKTKIILLAIAIMGSGLLYSQDTSDKTNAKSEKKVLKKIQRKMNHINLKEYLKEGENSKLVISYSVNENNEVELTAISGGDEDLKQAVIHTLKRHPVKCDSNQKGSSNSFSMNFVLMPV